MPLAQQDIRPLIDFSLAPLLEDHGIPLAVMGILVVFSVLVLIAAFIQLLPKLTASLHRAAEQEPAAAPLVEDELSEEILVVIAAAVAETIRVPHRIVRVRGLTPEDLGWSLEGRMKHHHSHGVQSRDRR